MNLLKSLRQLKPVQAILIFILAAGALLRVYNLQDSLQFLGDQGRDALVVSRIFTEQDLVFIGPVTSVGNMYLGPFYYYFMLPFLWLSYPSPMGPVYAVAVLGVVTLALVYFLGKRLVGQRAALIATFFFAFSSVILTYTRFSWNPNLAPLVSILMIYFTYAAWQKKSQHWIWVALCFAILLQLHYLTMLAAGGAGLIWLISFWEKWQNGRKKQDRTELQKQLGQTFLGGLVILVSFTPLVLFDFKHDWLNAKAFGNLLFGERNFKIVAQTSLPQELIKTVTEMHGRGMHILFETMIGQVRKLNSLLLFLVSGILGWKLVAGLKNQDQHPYLPGVIVLTAYLVTGIIGTALYEHSIFDHYVAYLFPVTCLVFGLTIDWLIQKLKLIGWGLGLVFAAYFLQYNLARLPLADAGWTITDMKAVAQTIADRVAVDEKYNLVLLSATGDIDGQNYRYFLSTTDKPPVKTEQRGEVETLFIINEDRQLERVIDSPIYEIVVFPDKEPVEVYEIPQGPEITVLKKDEAD